MLITATLPADSGLQVSGLAVADDAVLIVVTATGEAVPRPCCGHLARRIHSHYRRTAADLPWQGLAVRLELHHVRRFWCDIADCPRQIFAERLPGVVAPGARRSERLSRLYLAIGLALGGEAGTRLAADMGLRVSSATLLRVVQAQTLSLAEAPRVIGVDDWAWRKGRRYGTIIGCAMSRLW